MLVPSFIEDIRYDKIIQDSRLLILILDEKGIDTLQGFWN